MMGNFGNYGMMDSGWMGFWGFVLGLNSIVWLVVGILGAVWLWRKLQK